MAAGRARPRKTVGAGCARARSPERRPQGCAWQRDEGGEGRVRAAADAKGPSDPFPLPDPIRNASVRPALGRRPCDDQWLRS